MPLMAREGHPDSPISGFKLTASNAALAGAAIDIPLGTAPFDGELVDVVMGQQIAGANGTSWSAQVKKQTKGGSLTSMLDTAGVLTLAAGDAAGNDAKKRIPAIASCTRPVLAVVTATRRVKKGDAIRATVTPTGTYSVTLPTLTVTAIFKAAI